MSLVFIKTRERKLLRGSIHRRMAEVGGEDSGSSSDEGDIHALSEFSKCAVLDIVLPCAVVFLLSRRSF